MIKWTTPRVKCTIPPDLPLDYVLVTFKQGCVAIEKKVMSEQIEEGIFYIDFTQEETSQFNIGLGVDVQINIMSGSTRLASRILKVNATKNLHDEVIGDSPETILEITENGIYSVNGYNKVNVNVEGIQPTGSLEISENGVYDITNYAEVDVNIPSKTKYVIYDVICTNENISQEFGGVWFNGIVADLSKTYKVDFKGKTYSLDYQLDNTNYLSCPVDEIDTCEDMVLIDFNQNLYSNKWFYHMSYDEAVLPNIDDEILIYYEE